MRKDITAGKSQSTRGQCKPKQTNEQWHQERYGELRDKLSDQHLKGLVENICGKNYDAEAAAALCLLMDEIERSQFDRASLQNIALTVGSAAFGYTDHQRSAEEKLVLTMRRQLAGKELVN